MELPVSKIVKHCDSVMGVRFWRQDYTLRTPSFEVFRCIGHNRDSGHFFFQNVRDPVQVITRSYSQLNRNGFFPFLLDPALIDGFIKACSTQYEGA